MFLFIQKPYVSPEVVSIVMSFDCSAALAVSLTVNGCVLLYSLCLRLQTFLARKCCCDNYNIPIVVSQVYEDKPDQLAKRVTEQLVLIFIVFLSFVCLCTSGLLLSPFRCDIDHAHKVLIQVTLGMYMGKYVYVIAQHVHAKTPTSTARLRIDMVHHLTTLTCYAIFLIFMENLLLALVGVTMELNTSVIEFTRTVKDVNQTKTGFYRKLSIVGCVVTTVFRGVVPAAYLVLSILRETPFDMSYTSLTAFFVSLIFYSVINVWLILNAVQRLYNVYKYRRAGFTCEQDYTEAGHRSESGNTDVRKNNLGYMRSYDNRNLAYNDGKLNTNKKDFFKESIRLPLSFYIDNMADNRSVQLACSPEDREDSANNDRLNGSRIQNDFGSLRDSTSSTNSDISGDNVVTIFPDLNRTQFVSQLASNLLISQGSYSGDMVDGLRLVSSYSTTENSPSSLHTEGDTHSLLSDTENEDNS